MLSVSSGGSVATRRRISALCYWFWICSWFEEIEVSSVWAINYLCFLSSVFPGPCVHAFSDWQSSLGVEWISFFPAMSVSTVNERCFGFGGKTHPKPPWQVFLCQVLTQYLVKQRNSLKIVPWSFSCLRRSAGVKWLKLLQFSSVAQHRLPVPCECTDFHTLPASTTN